MEAGPLKIHKDTQKDVLMVNQVTRGKLGAAQLQIVLNLKPVRALAKKILDEKVTEISGDRQRFAHPKAVAKLTNRLAIRGICGFSLFSAKSPLAALSPQDALKKAGTASGAKYARVNKIVVAYKQDKLKKYGGFDGLKKRIAMKRGQEGNALLAQGVPPQIVSAKIERMKSEDNWVIAEAARQLGLEEVHEEKMDSAEDKDEASGFSYSKLYPENTSSGWNPFKRKKKSKQSPEQRMAAAQARSEAAQAESDARTAENAAKEAEDALKDGGTLPDSGAPDGGGPPDRPMPDMSGSDIESLRKLQKTARVARYKAHHAKRRYHKAMKAGTMMGEVEGHRHRRHRHHMRGAGTAETAASSAVPGGPATMAVAKFAYKKGGKKHAASAVKLAKARNGDPSAIADIKKTNAAAKKGDKRAQAEMKRLQTVNHLARRAESRYTTLLRAGVAGFRPSTKESGTHVDGEKTIEGMYGDTLSSGCS